MLFRQYNYIYFCYLIIDKYINNIINTYNNIYTEQRNISRNKQQSNDIHIEGAKRNTTSRLSPRATCRQAGSNRYRNLYMNCCSILYMYVRILCIFVSLYSFNIRIFRVFRLNISITGQTKI